MTDPSPEQVVEQLREGPPVCAEFHDGFQKCGGADSGCYRTEGDYQEDARYIYPARERWWAATASSAADTITSLIEERDALEERFARMDDWLLRIASAFDRGTASSMEECVSRAEAASAEAEALRKALREIADECGNVMRPGGQTYERTMVVHFARKVHSLAAASLPTPEQETP